MTSRIEALKALMKRWHIEMPADDMPHRTSSTEDLEPYLTGEEPINGPWAVVTHGTGSTGDEITYIYPGYETLEAAQVKAIANVGDSIFEETPHSIVNLDTVETLHPRWDTVKWAAP